MNTSYKLITLCVTFTLIGSACAFARPTPYFQNDYRWHEKSTVERHVPTARASGRTGYARSPDKDGWPANMLLN
ncbi:hypothetical protein SAMN05444159_6925 [Bradyrhizobium lablabi]|jgi:hypothetical protein|uniref:Lipoprotein n=1 Tax=Bradyrhizobium lablabi TaxID=722472 RepID=A0A1M7DTE5_9BRAD|nr:hypothetical protein [Bradyrhizobium lablabi]SHL82765.1 hypothetical protein SAMN05444159_6925 [Bradyrhizobium lablabi]